ncbi:MAG: transcriptional repressor [Bacteroidales bacterium]|nr:transcriptional repressor [Bacteroidales bacterium]
MLVLSSLMEMKSHPSADDLIDYIKADHPNIAVGTIYKILDIFVEAGIIERVRTSRDIMRYDMISEKHHHIYINGSDNIIDFYDPDLDNLLEGYFRNRKIPGIEVDDLTIQITGRFTESNKDNQEI